MTTLERLLAGLASILGIVTFFHQFGHVILGKIIIVFKTPNIGLSHKLRKSLLVIASPLNKLAEKRFLSGILFSLGAAILWSLSYTSYRSAELRQLDALAKAIPIFFIGGLTILLLAFFFKFLDTEKYQTKVFEPLFAWSGLFLIFGHAFEFLCMLLATHYISAGQMITLYKVNPLWLLILLIPVTKQRVGGASIAAVACVMIGVYLIVSPDFVKELNLNSSVGSILAIAGGFFFAVYSVYTFAYPLHYGSSSSYQRLLIQGTLFMLAVLLYILISVFTKTLPSYSYSSDAVFLLVLNGLRVGIVYILYSEALKRIHPVLVACIVALEVPLTIISEYYWLGVPASSSLVMGSAIILLGILSIIKENSLFIQRVDPNMETSNSRNNHHSN